MDQAIKLVLPETEQNAEILKAITERISPAGALGLPPLLDAMRLKYAITDGAFKAATLFDRVLVYQIPEEDTAGGKFGEGSLIFKSDQGRDRDKRETPRGVLIGAGMKALDILRSNGVDLGHIVYFINSQPWRLYFDYIAGKKVPALPMNAGDVILSETLQTLLRAGKVKMCRVDGKHMYVDENGEMWDPANPWASDDSI